LRSSEGRKAAMPFFERAMDVAQAKGDADGKSRVRAALAKLAEQEGDVKQAVELYQSAVNSSEDGWRTSDIRRSLANLFIARKDWEAAAKQLESNVAFYEKQRCNKSLIETYSTLAEVYEAAGKSEDAARCLRLSMDLYRSPSEERPRGRRRAVRDPAPAPGRERGVFWMGRLGAVRRPGRGTAGGPAAADAARPQGPTVPAGLPAPWSASPRRR